MSTEYWDAATGEALSDSDLHERYNEMLDEVYGEIKLGEMSYDMSRVLGGIDPIAYRCGFNDWLDSELGESITDSEPESDDLDELEDLLSSNPWKSH